MTKEITVFHHIPKTAGTTFNSILEREYPAKTRFGIDGMNPARSLNQYMNLTRQERNAHLLLYGHLADHFLPFLTRKSVWIVFLRDPVDHFISSFFYIRRSTHNRHSHLVANFSKIEEYIEFCKEKRLDNLQTRHIAGETGFILDAAKTPADMTVDGAEIFLRAKQRLEKTEFVLLTEYFDKSVMLLHRQLKWKSFPFYQIRNRTKNRPTAESFSPESLDSIRALCSWDIKLYALAKQQFFERLKEIDPRFQRQVWKFVMLNRVFNIFHR